VIIELSNPQLERDTVTAEWDLKAAESGFADFQLRLRSEELSQAADMARMQSDHEQAKVRYESRLNLYEDGLVSTLDLQEYRVIVEQSANRIEIEKQRAAIRKESVEAQLLERRTQVEKSQAMYDLRKSQLEQLNVQTGVDGILQELLVDVGQRVSMGSNLARVTNPGRLKAELSISETSVKDIQIGQSVSVDTRNGVVAGVVSRIDPAVRSGAVTVDVRFTEELPTGSRPDLSVDGTIVLEKLEEVVYVGLPVQGQSNSQISLFKLSADGKTAERVKVRLGNTSVNTVEIQEGLKPGDQVILSDMSAHDGVDSIRLN
jgi:HlyD family secretion protein